MPEVAAVKKLLKLPTKMSKFKKQEQQGAKWFDNRFVNKLRTKALFIQRTTIEEDSIQEICEETVNFKLNTYHREKFSCSETTMSTDTASALKNFIHCVPVMSDRSVESVTADIAVILHQTTIPSNVSMDTVLVNESFLMNPMHHVSLAKDPISMVLSSIPLSAISMNIGTIKNISGETLPSGHPNTLSNRLDNVFTFLRFLPYLYCWQYGISTYLGSQSVQPVSLLSTDDDTLVADMETQSVYGRMMFKSKEKVYSFEHIVTFPDEMYETKLTETELLQEQLTNSAAVPSISISSCSNEFPFHENLEKTETSIKFDEVPDFQNTFSRIRSTLNATNDFTKRSLLKRTADTGISFRRHIYRRRSINASKSFSPHNMKEQSFESHKKFEREFDDEFDDIEMLLHKRPKLELDDTEFDEPFSGKIDIDRMPNIHGEVPGKNMRIAQQSLHTNIFRKFDLSGLFVNEDPRWNISYMHDFIFDTDYDESDDIENLAIHFDELAEYLSANDSVLSNFFRRHIEHIDSTGMGSIDDLRRAKYFLGLKQISSNGMRMFIIQLQRKLEEKVADGQELKPKIRLITVPAEVFENAMRQCQIYEYELTFSNYFPRNCRMFIAIPVYKGGFINRRDTKDRQ